MQLSEFDYKLPEELIAQNPIEPRDSSRLLKLNPKNNKISESKFYNIIDDLTKDDVLVLNKTKVINSRLHWKIQTSGRIAEIFLHKQINNNTWDCLIFPWKKLKPGRQIYFYLDDKSNPVMKATIKEMSSSWRIIEFDKWGIDFLEIIDSLWEIPLPPYIKQKLEKNDRYQTIWSEVEWSVAAPTASLHFTEELLQKIQKKWIKIEKVLLHIWLGTFMPVKSQNIIEHNMHSEYIELEKDVAKRLNQYKKEWKRIIAVGTTAIRVLESFSDDKWVIDYWEKDTDIFIYPWYNWKFVDAMITNFHLPKSTLLMLVASFASKEFILKAYNYAVKNKFRFFSFGDAMFIQAKK